MAPSAIQQHPCTSFDCLDCLLLFSFHQAELEASGVLSSSKSSNVSAASTSGRDMRLGLLLSKPRRGFGAPLTLVDAPASELWASNTMEARPFRDTNYDLKRAQRDTAVQAVPVLRDAAVQVCTTWQ